MYLYTRDYSKSEDDGEIEQEGTDGSCSTTKVDAEEEYSLMIKIVNQVHHILRDWSKRYKVIQTMLTLK